MPCPHSSPFTKPVVYLGPKPATAHQIHYYLQPDTQQDFPLADHSPLCASKLTDRKTIKPRLKLLFFRYAEHGHLLYFSDIRDHGHSELQCFGRDVLWKREKGRRNILKKGVQAHALILVK